MNEKVSEGSARDHKTNNNEKVVATKTSSSDAVAVVCPGVTWVPAPVSHADQMLLEIAGLWSIAAATMSSSLSAGDEDVCFFPVQLMRRAPLVSF